MRSFWQPPRHGALLFAAAATVPLYLWFGALAAILAVACLALGFIYGRQTCDNADLRGHR